MELDRQKRSTLKLPLLLALAGATGCSRLSADTVEPEVIYGELMCACGTCNQTLAECNHIGCAYANPMREEVDQHLANGDSPQEVLDFFAAKYGLSVLAAPPTAGWFNIAAWVMPFAALTLGLGVVGYFARRFRSRPGRAAADLSETAPSEFQKRLEEELADFTPED